MYAIESVPPVQMSLKQTYRPILQQETTNTLEESDKIDFQTF